MIWAKDKHSVRLCFHSQVSPKFIPYNLSILSTRCKFWQEDFDELREIITLCEAVPCMF